MNKKYAVQGIVGCVLFGVGDWLLGFVDPEDVQAKRLGLTGSTLLVGKK